MVMKCFWQYFRVGKTVRHQGGAAHDRGFAVLILQGCESLCLANHFGSAEYEHEIGGRLYADAKPRSMDLA